MTQITSLIFLLARIVRLRGKVKVAVHRPDQKKSTVKAALHPIFEVLQGFIKIRSHFEKILSITKLALFQRRLHNPASQQNCTKWFEACTCIPAPAGLPPSNIQHQRTCLLILCSCHPSVFKLLTGLLVAALTA